MSLWVPVTRHIKGPNPLDPGRSYLKIGDRIEHRYHGRGTVEGVDSKVSLSMIVLYDDDDFGHGPIRIPLDLLEPQDWRWLTALELLAEAGD